ncbi:Prokaryotic lipoprotein-attachment site [Bartonella apihabitans]
MLAIFERDAIMKKTLTGLVVVTICGVALAGCGRKGPLEPPPSTMIEDSNGKMVQKPKVEKPFILDPLIKQRH